MPRGSGGMPPLEIFEFAGFGNANTNHNLNLTLTRCESALAPNIYTRNTCMQRPLSHFTVFHSWFCLT